MENYNRLRNEKQENNETILMAIKRDGDKWLEIIFFHSLSQRKSSRDFLKI